MHRPEQWEGEWKDDKRLNGKGTIIYDSGNKYIGDFSDGKRNGYGVSEYKNSKLVKEWSEQMHKVAHFIELVHNLSKFFGFRE